jgi:biopolymer transport protein ExbB
MNTWWNRAIPAVIDLFEQGGLLMFPLLLLSILALWIFLERCYRLWRANGKVEPLFATVQELVLKLDWERAYLWARAYPGPVAAVFAALLRHQAQDKADLEELATVQARQELRRLIARLPLLNLIAALAPLIGLLGTVVGMVKAFQQVASAPGAVNPSLLANGIWEALLTTVAGLLVAIPALLFHYYLQQRIQQYAFQMDHYGTLLIRLLTQTVHRDA